MLLVLFVCSAAAEAAALSPGPSASPARPAVDARVKKRRQLLRPSIKSYTSVAMSSEGAADFQRYQKTLVQMRRIEAEMTNKSIYWSRRRFMPLYQRMVALAKERAANALTVLDVGAYESPLLSRFEWIPTKVATDIQQRRRVWHNTRGIAFVVADFMQLRLGTRFDLVICNQVVEHLNDSLVERFVSKLASHTAQTLIVSTTFEMPSGTIRGHVQDPISERTFRSWFSRKAVRDAGSLEIEYVPGRFLHNSVSVRKGAVNPKHNILGIWTRRAGAAA